MHPTAPLAPRAAAARRPRARAPPRAALARRAEDVQPPPRPLGLHGPGRRRRAADDPEHGHGRAERGDRDRGALRPRRRHAASASARAVRWPPSWRSATWSSSRRRSAFDGTSRALGAGERVARPAPVLVTALRGRGAARAPAPVVSHRPLLRRPAGARSAGGRQAGALAIEMETATLFASARGAALRAGCLLVVSDLLTGSASGSTPRRCRRASTGWRGCGGTDDARGRRRATRSGALPRLRRRPGASLAAAAGLEPAWALRPGRPGRGLGCAPASRQVSIRSRRSSMAIGAARASPRRRPSSRCSSRSMPSSIASRRWDTDRRRRVRRSRSLAEGRFRAPSRRLLRPHRLLARLERRRQRPADERVVEQFVSQLPDGLLALAGDPLPEALVFAYHPPASERRHRDDS